MPTPAVPRHGVTRRTALASALAVGAVAAGCTPQEVVTPSRLPRPTPSDGLDPDVALAADTLKQEQSMLDALTATAARHRSLRSALAAAVTAHERHVRLLTRAVPAQVRPSATASATAGPTAGASSSPAAPASGSAAHSASAGPGSNEIPRDTGRAVRSLVRQEDRLSLANKRASFAAGSGAFARLLASMAAAAAQQAVVLGENAGSRRRRR